MSVGSHAQTKVKVFQFSSVLNSSVSNWFAVFMATVSPDTCIQNLYDSSCWQLMFLPTLRVYDCQAYNVPPISLSSSSAFQRSDHRRPGRTPNILLSCTFWGLHRCAQARRYLVKTTSLHKLNKTSQTVHHLFCLSVQDEPNKTYFLG